jgi:hypothetical protein
MSNASHDGHFDCPHCHRPIRVMPAPEAVSRPASYPREPQRRRPDGSLEPAPMTIERARAFVLPFGKFQGRTLEDVGSTDEGRRYLEWGAGQWDRALGRAVKFFLEHSNA